MLRKNVAQKIREKQVGKVFITSFKADISNPKTWLKKYV